MLFTNGRIATMQPDAGAYGVLERAAIVVRGEKIVWVGPIDDLPEMYSGLQAIDVGGRLITPGLIDCHTHIVFGGHRAREFEQRLNGASYEEIARAGGGIMSTVRDTRAATDDELLHGALSRVDALIAEGVTTIEVKSGYGLSVQDELRMLQVARRIARLRPVRVRTSYLAAHALPPEYENDHDGYIETVVLPGLKQAQGQGLVDAVDGFCEKIAFTPEQIERVFLQAEALGLRVKIHAEQLSNMGGASLAARFHALSADHLEYLDEKGVTDMAEAGSVAVLLPGAYYTLAETQLPPVEAFRAQGVPIAVATDCNPGSSPLTSILLTLNMAATLFRLTPEEVLAGATRNAARALGLDDCGVIAPGKRADLAIWDVEHPAELAYRIGFNPLHKRVFAGIF